MTEPILAVISGFLGAGKTTLSTNLIAYLWERDVNAALITNDQSSGLVDSEIASAGGVNVKEISGGCFCCRCDEFALALDETDWRGQKWIHKSDGDLRMCTSFRRSFGTSS